MTVPHTLSVLLLVGDRYSSFADHEAVRTAGQFIGDLREGRYDNLPRPILIHVWQGLDEAACRLLRAEIDGRGLTEMLVLPDTLPPLCRGEVNKRRLSNVLIAGLKETDECRYTAMLRIHNDNELQLDHTTGEHIQGMVIIEAMRQMARAVGATLLQSRGRSDDYFLLSALNVTFRSFLFPLPTALTAEVFDIRPGATFAYRVRIIVEQARRLAAEGVVGLTAYSQKGLSPVEHYQARQAILTAITDGVGQSPPPAFPVVGRMNHA